MNIRQAGAALVSRSRHTFVHTLAVELRLTCHGAAFLAAMQFNTALLVLGLPDLFSYLLITHSRRNESESKSQSNYLI
jgi:hypothetical protein